MSTVDRTAEPGTAFDAALAGWEAAVADPDGAVERVARALSAAEGYGHISHAFADYFRRQAQAAIDAMKAPTPSPDAEPPDRLPCDAQWDFADVPLGLWDGANRYKTDDEDVLTLWRKNGTTFDLRSRRRPFDEATATEVTPTSSRGAEGPDGLEEAVAATVGVLRLMWGLGESQSINLLAADALFAGPLAPLLDRAAKAEAAVARVEALADSLDVDSCDPMPDERARLLYDTAVRIRHALDGAS